MITKRSMTVQVAGAAESAVGEARLSLGGPHKLYAVAVNHTGQPATADVTVTDAFGADGPGAVFAKANSGTDAFFYPRAAAAKAADGSASTLTEVCPVVEEIVASVAQGSAGTVKVTAYLEG